jgi:hypothetical protein
VNRLIVVAAAAAVAVGVGAGFAPPADAQPTPDPKFLEIGTALQAHGISACETDWGTRSPTQDGSSTYPSGKKKWPEERDRRSRIVVLAPQPCPALDPESGDVYGDDTDLVGVIDVYDFKSRTAGASLKRHGKDYTKGIGYVWQGRTLIDFYPLPPPGMEQAFVAAMKDLGARRKYASELSGK